MKSFVEINGPNDLYLDPMFIRSIRTSTGVGGTDFVIIDYDWNDTVREFQIECSSKEEAKSVASRIVNKLLGSN
jgi:hypothetical protein